MKNKIIIAMLSLSLVMGSAVFAADTKEKETTETVQDVKEETEDEKAEKEESEEKAEETEKEEEEPEEKEDIYRLVSVQELEKYVDLAEYKGIAYEKEDIAVTDEMVSSEIVYRRKSQAEDIKDEKVPVESGDIVDIAYIGRKDGEAFEGGSSDGYSLEIGSGSFIDGFEDGVIGMKIGETKNLDLTFPEEYPAEDLAGEKVVFEVTLHGIQRVPDLTDEWVAANTDLSTVEEYKESIMEELRVEMEMERDQNLKYTLFNSVMDNSNVKEYPEPDLTERSKEFTDYVEEMVSLQGMEMDEYLELQGTNREYLEEQAREYGEYSVKIALVIQAIMDAEGMRFDSTEADLAKVQLAQSIGATSFEQIIEYYGEFDAYASLGEEMISNFIVNNAVVSETPVEELDGEEIPEEELDDMEILEEDAEEVE